MIRLALVMGRQGSGKTTRICAALRQDTAMRPARWWSWRKPVVVLDNVYNHLARDASGQLAFVSGMTTGRVAHPISTHFARGRFVIELPHGGYLPDGCQAVLNRGRLQTRIFVIELPEATWRGFGGTVGCITSAEYFMTRGPLIRPRADCDYAADLRLIRATIAASGIPATYHSSADEAIAAIRAFIGR